MSLVITDASALLVLTKLLQDEDWWLRLFSNNVTPAAGTIVGDLTELSGGGYAAKTLTGASWNVAANPAVYAEQIFTFTGIPAPATVYGYYLVGKTSGIFIPERFAALITLTEATDRVLFTPQVIAGSA